MLLISFYGLETLTSGSAVLHTERLHCFWDRGNAALWLTWRPQQTPGPYKPDHNSPGRSAEVTVRHINNQLSKPVACSLFMPQQEIAICKVNNKKHVNVTDLKPAAGVSVNTQTHIHRCKLED